MPSRCCSTRPRVLRPPPCRRAVSGIPACLSTARCDALSARSAQPLSQRPGEQAGCKRQPLTNVALEEPARLVQEALRPLEPEPLEDHGGAGLVTGQEAQ